ncbi:MAG: aldolase [Acetobacteraceae bacterium]|nr:aldolase [Acetobacteraceae bacterium]
MDLQNPVLTRMRSGDVAMGMNVRLARSGDIARIAATTGHDFIFIDGQHAIFDSETIAHIAQTALGVGVAPMVRVLGTDDLSTSQLLDNGVTGIIFPNVNTVEQARKAVAMCKFPPFGQRSVGGGYPQFNHRSMPIADATRQLNASTVVVCMIETPEGLANVEDIASVDGIDVLHVGTNDLLVNMGLPGQFSGPKLESALLRVIAAAKANNKFTGLGGLRDIASQATWVRRGISFLTTQADIGFINAAASAWTAGVRKAIVG